ncbi:DUF2062 domain-containing protein [Parapedomonas caeni]
MFRRRQPLPLIPRLINRLWPRQGLRRTLLYYRHRLLRLPGTPHGIAAGVASGIAMSFSPLGLHVVLAMALALVTRGNLLAATLATILFGNPVVVGLLMAADIGLGEMLVGKHPSASTPDISLITFFQHPVDAIEHFGPAFAAGAIVLAAIGWVLAYIAMRKLIVFAHHQRARRLRARQRLHERGAA